MDPPTDSRDGAADRLGGDPPASGLAPEPAVAPTITGPLFPTTGQLWHHYRLTDPILGGPDHCFHAIDMEEFVNVDVRVTQVCPETEARRAAWAVLKDLREPWMPALMEAHEEDGLRYEVSRPPLALTLREWRAKREIGLPDFESLVRQLASIVQVLHTVGLVHLNLRLDTLHVASTEGDLQIQLGGLEHATLFDQPHPFAVPVNPLYAPPEAVGLEMQPPGRALCSWDWWGIGRVMQEFVLGRHIYGDLLQCDVSHDGAGLRAEAKVLLTETGDYRVRAGAVELMPAMYDSQISLLRGLLATVRAGRWGFREVQRWLDHRPAKDRYDSPGDERFFIRVDEVLTVPEAAEFFAQEANWVEGEASLFNAADPQSFASFVEKDPGNYDLYTRLKGLLDLDGTKEWIDLPKSARQSALAGLAWATFAGPKVGLYVRGRRMTRHELVTLVHGEGDAPALGSALLAPPFLRELQLGDPETASMLSEVAAECMGVQADAVKNGWMTAGDSVASLRILTLCLGSPHELGEAQRRLRTDFACTRNPAVQALMAAAVKERKAQILLAYAESCPDRFGFVTQETLDNEQYVTLRQESLRLAAALFWLRLKEALASNPLVFGSWNALAVSCLGLGAFAWVAGLHFDQHAGVYLFLAIPPFLRLVHWYRMGRMIEPYATQGQPWLWTDGAERCRNELARALPGADVRSIEQLTRQLSEMNWKVAEIPLKQAPQLVASPGWLFGLWTTSVFCWLIMALVFSRASNTGIRRIVSSAWGYSVQRHMSVAQDVDAEAGLPASDWSFGDPRHKQIPWDLPKPATMPKVGVGKILVATADQIAYALVEGERELTPYRRRTVEPLIAVRVHAEEAEGFILFDGRDGTVAERRVYLVDKVPPVRSWFELGRHLAVYLGVSKQEIDSREPAPADVLQGVP
jgi:hypothetical protein